MKTQNRHVVVDKTPVGTIIVMASGEAISGLFMQAGKHLPEPATFGISATSDPFLQRAVDQLEAYFAGELTQFDLPVRAEGTPFQQRVWKALREIPYGETRSYGELAQSIGQPTASRAVGLANGRNPVSIVVPCHRVVGANGSLTGYGGGINNKRVLLGLERGPGSDPKALF